MALIKSVSGIRGTIGGQPEHNFTPIDIVAFVSAYAHFIRLENLGKESTLPYATVMASRAVSSVIKSKEKVVSVESAPGVEKFKEVKNRLKIVIGRDGRLSGLMVKNLAISTLQLMGFDVIDLDYSTTPTVEMEVKLSSASGGIIITASHNTAEWNALKFLNAEGEFISQELGEKIKLMAESGIEGIEYASIEDIGKVTLYSFAIDFHIQSILQHRLIHKEVIEKAKLKVVVDAINSTGAMSIPPLLEKLGVECVLINGDNSGQFAHNPEPLPEHLTVLCKSVITHGADLGISVDPDVDRLALVDENGVFFGEEYTLVCVADFVLSQKKGPVVTNLSSSMALKDLADKYGVSCHFAPVGEVHVVKQMKEVGAVIGGEGNGGVIDPQLHYGRDALIGIAFILMHIAGSKKSLSELKKGYSQYVMVKDKISFDPSKSPQELLDKVAEAYKTAQLDVRDGLKVVLPDGWVQLRKSNTEPILRIYAEGRTAEYARKLVDEVKALL